MNTPIILTNGHRRPILDGYSIEPGFFLPGGEFDYLDPGEWQGFVYKGEYYDLGEFMPSCDPFMTKKGWQRARADSFSSALVIKLDDDGEYVTVGLYLT